MCSYSSEPRLLVQTVESRCHHLDSHVLELVGNTYSDFNILFGGAVLSQHLLDFEDCWYAQRLCAFANHWLPSFAG